MRYELAIAMKAIMLIMGARWAAALQLILTLPNEELAGAAWQEPSRAFSGMSADTWLEAVPVQSAFVYVDVVSLVLLSVHSIFEP